MSSFWHNFYYRLHREATSRAASDENFIKMIFPFQCSCNWIILTFRADLVHVYIICCGHVYSYKIQYTSSVYAYLIWFSPCIPILNFTCHKYIICKQPSFIIENIDLSFIGKSNYRTCWCLWTGTCVVPGHRHPPWRTMAAGTKAVHIARNHSHASGRELKATG